MSNWKLFLDDLRGPLDIGLSVHEMRMLSIARNSEEAKSMVVSQGCPSHIYFDHDLGGDDTSMRFIDWLIDYDMQHDVITPVFSYTVHSANPVGRDNIIGKLDHYLKWKREGMVA